MPWNFNFIERARLPIGHAKVLITNVIHIRFQYTHTAAEQYSAFSECMAVETFLVRMPNIYLLLTKANTMRREKSELFTEVFSYSFAWCCLADSYSVPFVPWLLALLLLLFSRWKIDRIEWDEMRNNNLNIWLVVKSDVNWKLNPKICPFLLCVCNCFQYLFSNVLLQFSGIATVMMSVFSFVGVCFCIELLDFSQRTMVVLLFSIWKEWKKEKINRMKRRKKEKEA